MFAKFFALRFSKKLLIFLFVCNTLFSICVLYIAYKVQYEPAVLVGGWFSFMSVQVWSTSKITRARILKEEKDNE